MADGYEPGRPAPPAIASGGRAATRMDALGEMASGEMVSLALRPLHGPVPISTKSATGVVATRPPLEAQTETHHLASSPLTSAGFDGRG
jgi:hypothetical protein